ncbi:hypothetical protein KAJ61_06135, partial [Candidatus Parcubacteria bacterium]|nr:hypothetical protein [Candidatus Parcubacteria bacterium]
MIKNNNKPTLKEWKKLYELAIKFEKLAPWNWMYDVDVFGVMDPETKTIGYCSVMGNNKEFYGLGIYPGAEGFESLDILARGEVPDDVNERMHTQKCLMMAYDKRDFITKEDMEIIKKIDVRFDNRNFWPTFLDYSPGYHPWPISGKDAGFLTTVVEQAIDVVLDYKDKKEDLMFYIPAKFAVKVPEEKNKKLIWHYEYLAPEKYIKNDKIPVLNEADEVLAYNIKKEIEMDYELVWELDFFRMQKPVKNSNGDTRPYYPYTLLIVEKISGVVITVELSDQSDAKVAVFRKAFLGAIKKFNILPKT